MTRAAIRDFALNVLAAAIVLVMGLWVVAGWVLMFVLLFEVARWPWWAALSIGVSTWWLVTCTLSYFLDR